MMGIIKKFRIRVYGYLVQYGLLVVWITVNAFIFLSTFKKYKQEPQYYYLRQMLGNGLCISRGSGAIINVSCALLTLSMCRCFITLLRRYVRKIPMRVMSSIVNHCKAIHITCAFTIVIASVIHSAAHMINAANVCSYYNSSLPVLNVADFSGQNPFYVMIITVPGITGVVMLAVLLVMAIMSIKCIRIKFYNSFWYSHRFFVVFFALLIWHPMSGLLKEQINMEKHPPGCFEFNKATAEEEEGSSPFHIKIPTNCSTPHFVANKSQTCLWVVLPLCLYVIDFLIRLLTRSQPVKIVSVRRLPGSLMQLTLRRSNGPPVAPRPRPGQYVLIQCPGVSACEWHPYSISNCSGTDNQFEIHVRSRGDWSKSLSQHLTSARSNAEHILPAKRGDCDSPKTRLYVDGPFGSALEDVLYCPINVCVAGGVGITPFASIFQALLLAENVDIYKIRRLHFIWLCRDVQSILWFAELLCRLHFKLWRTNRPDLLDIQLFLTRENNLDRVQVGNKLSILERRIRFGRPNWKTIFREFQIAYPKRHISVFSCGPKTLNDEIYKRCRSQRQNDKDCAKFSFYHESFL